MIVQEGAARGELPADLEAALMAGRLPLEVLRAYLRLASVPVLGALCRAFPGEGLPRLHACQHGQQRMLWMSTGVLLADVRAMHSLRRLVVVSEHPCSAWRGKRATGQGGVGVRSAAVTMSPPWKPNKEPLEQARTERSILRSSQPNHSHVEQGSGTGSSATRASSWCWPSSSPWGPAPSGPRRCRPAATSSGRCVVDDGHPSGKD